MKNKSHQQLPVFSRSSSRGLPCNGKSRRVNECTWCPPWRRMAAVYICALLWDNFHAFIHFVSLTQLDCPLGWLDLEFDSNNNFNNIKVLLFISWPINYIHLTESGTTSSIRMCIEHSINSFSCWCWWQGGVQSSPPSLVWLGVMCNVCNVMSIEASLCRPELDDRTYTKHTTKMVRVWREEEKKKDRELDKRPFHSFELIVCVMLFTCEASPLLGRESDNNCVWCVFAN